jgi:hypothetical protein
MIGNLAGSRDRLSMAITDEMRKGGVTLIRTSPRWTPRRVEDAERPYRRKPCQEVFGGKLMKTMERETGVEPATSSLGNRP